MPHKPLLTVYSLSHALVDFSCAFLVYRTMLDAPELGLCLLLYNFCAFALQMPFGLLVDGWNRNGLTAAAGCALVACAYLPVLPALAASVTAGIGNGLFHVGGGLDVLNDSRERAAALGITELVQKEGSLRFSLPQPDFAKVAAVCGLEKYKGRLLFSAGDKPYLSLRLKKGDDVLKLAGIVLRDFEAAG